MYLRVRSHNTEVCLIGTDMSKRACQMTCKMRQTGEYDEAVLCCVTPQCGAVYKLLLSACRGYCLPTHAFMPCPYSLYERSACTSHPAYAPSLRTACLHPALSTHLLHVRPASALPHCTLQATSSPQLKRPHPAPSTHLLHTRTAPTLHPTPSTHLLHGDVVMTRRAPHILPAALNLH